MHKRGQFWYMDFIVGLMIITLVSIMFIMVAKEISIKQYSTNQLVNTAVSISGSFMSKGQCTPNQENPGSHSCSNWINKKGRIGLLTDNKIDNDKLRELKKLLEIRYKTSKYLLGIGEEYALVIEYFDQQGNLIRDIYGNPDLDDEQFDVMEKENIRIVRYAYYNPEQEGMTNGQIARLVTVVWRE
ncbi:MAG: hypothetical protein KKG60_02595 [Nanoarchaeota archaeon]|nr:hypothetical protein [Nanoarchaeota archaeon]